MRLPDECADGWLLSVRLGCCSQRSTDVVRRRVFSRLRPCGTRVALLRGRRRESCDAASTCSDGAGRGTLGCGTAVDTLCSVRRFVARSHCRHVLAISGHSNAVLACRYFLRHSANCRPAARNEKSIRLSRRASRIRPCEDIAAIPRFALFAMERKWCQRFPRSNSLGGTGDSALVARITTFDAATISAIRASVGASVGATVGEPNLEAAAIPPCNSAAGGCGRT